MTHSKNLAASLKTKTKLVLRPDIFGPAPLIPGESLAEYETLLARVTASILPKDVLEEIWVWEIVNLFWDQRRLRRLKASLLQASLREGLERVLEPLLAANKSSLDPAGDLSRRWARREPRAMAEVDRLLQSAGLTMDAAMAEAYTIRLDDLERLEGLIARAEVGLNNSLREIDRHRETLLRALQIAMQTEDAEFVDVATGGAEAA